MDSSKGGVAHKTRKGRPGKDGPIWNNVNSSSAVDSASVLRAQRLRLIGIIGLRADLLATLAWGEAA